MVASLPERERTAKGGVIIDETEVLRAATAG